MIRGLIFDFDGLILDTEWPVYQSWVELFEQYGTELPFDLWASIIGTSSGEHFNPMDLLEQQVGNLPEREAVAGKRRQRELDLVVKQPVLPGVIDYLEAARGLDLKLGVASSSSYRWVGGHLSRLGLLDYFQVVHTSDNVTHTKPDPALFHLVLESLGLEPTQALVLEDSPNGVTAAKAAGLFTVAVPNPLTARLDLDHADLRLESLAEMDLAELLQVVESCDGQIDIEH
jgi:HAD superfamily hydrolase (TIGR01509 family)